ncbi:hypothetical protein NESM_000351000 [Novymonas esmeraldas]|uniref:KATNIP domain-containing protein n=1 Tax=Novymonas esmeraldas TaxID=1808958 RepID=A0AAW0EJM1_9TRYP
MRAPRRGGGGEDAPSSTAADAAPRTAVADGGSGASPASSNTRAAHDVAGATPSHTSTVSAEAARPVVHHGEQASSETVSPPPPPPLRRRLPVNALRALRSERASASPSSTRPAQPPQTHAAVARGGVDEALRQEFTSSRPSRAAATVSQPTPSGTPYTLGRFSTRAVPAPVVSVVADGVSSGPCSRRHSDDWPALPPSAAASTLSTAGPESSGTYRRCSSGASHASQRPCDTLDNSGTAVIASGVTSPTPTGALPRQRPSLTHGLSATHGLWRDSAQQSRSTTPPVSGNSSVYEVAHNAQSLMDVIHARRTSASNRLLERTARRGGGMPTASSDTAGTSLSSSASALPPPQVWRQSAPGTPRPSVYKDIYSTPEGLSGRGASPLPPPPPPPRRGLNSAAHCVGASDAVAPAATFATAASDGILVRGFSVAAAAVAAPVLSLAAAEPEEEEEEEEEATPVAARRVAADRSCSSSSSPTASPLLQLSVSPSASPLIPFSTDSPSRSAVVSAEGSCVCPASPPAPPASTLRSSRAVDVAVASHLLADGRARDDDSDAEGDPVDPAGAVADDAVGLAPVLADTVPCSRFFTVNLLTTWGDVHEIGLCGLELFDAEGRRVLPRPVAAVEAGVPAAQTASVKDGVVSLAASSPDGFVTAYAEYTWTEADRAAIESASSAGGEHQQQTDSRAPLYAAIASDRRRQLCSLLLPHPFNTHDEANMFVMPYTAGQPHRIHLVFAAPVRVSAMRLHNYAGKGRVHTTKGVHIAEAWVEEALVFRGVVRANSGELRRDECDATGSGSDDDDDAEDGAEALTTSDTETAFCPPHTRPSVSAYALVNCENVLWTTDTGVLARIMEHGPPLSMGVVPPGCRAGDGGVGGAASSSGADGQSATVEPRTQVSNASARVSDTASRRHLHRPATARGPHAPPLRYHFSSARRAEDAPRQRQHDDGPVAPVSPSLLSTVPHPAAEGRTRDTATGGGATATATATATAAEHIETPQQSRSSHRQYRRKPPTAVESCPQHVTAVCVMVLSTWGWTQHVGLSGLRLRDACGDVIDSVRVHCAAVHYPDGTSVTRTWGRNHPTPATDEDAGGSDPEAVSDADDAGDADLAVQLRDLLQQQPSHTRGSDAAGCRFPFQAAMQLVLVFHRPIAAVGVVDVANFAVGDATSCGAKDVRVFFATAALTSAETFRHLWTSSRSSRSQRALAAAQVFEVTPPTGVALRKAPALLDVVRFQSYDVSWHSAAMPAGAGTDGHIVGSGRRHTVASSACPAGPMDTQGAASGAIASGPGTGGGGCSGAAAADGEDGPPADGAGRWRATSMSLTAASSCSLGASTILRSTVAVLRARLSLLEERPAWLLDYQPYVTPLLPVGYVCKLRLTVCARDVPGNAADAAAVTDADAGATAAPVVTAGESLKAYLRAWLVKPLRACSFVKEDGEVIRPVRPDKYRAMRQDDARRRAAAAAATATAELHPGDAADAADAEADRERAMARCVPMVAESTVCVAPESSTRVGASRGHRGSPAPLQVVVELLYVADTPFCLSLLVLHTPLVVRGSAAWVRQLQVLVDDAVVFSSAEASVRLAAAKSGTTAARPGDADGAGGDGVAAGGASAPLATSAPCHSAFLQRHSTSSSSSPAASAAADEETLLWGHLPLCATTLKPYVLFSHAPQLLSQLHVDTDAPAPPSPPHSST